MLVRGRPAACRWRNRSQAAIEIETDPGSAAAKFSDYAWP